VGFVFVYCYSFSNVKKKNVALKKEKYEKRVRLGNETAGFCPSWMTFS